ncbi:hypothetical protein B4U80_09124 [Leptotrombidium deliense]|uniref:Uncharacterized protein n=1 Tax=Leptotrombidium deliense TaxID=299467 RepID=A0A443SP91_9ACAR|nr:hypothetical protein B4U80_09124 [Leptotrombidium deliense]
MRIRRSRWSTGTNKAGSDRYIMSSDQIHTSRIATYVQGI